LKPGYNFSYHSRRYYYYYLLGWDEEGVPRSDKLEELGLGEFTASLP